MWENCLPVVSCTDPYVITPASLTRINGLFRIDLTALIRFYKLTAKNSSKLQIMPVKSLCTSQCCIYVHFFTVTYLSLQAAARAAEIAVCMFTFDVRLLSLLTLRHMRDSSGQCRLRELILKSHFLPCMIDPNNTFKCIMCACMYIDLYAFAH